MPYRLLALTQLVSNLIKKSLRLATGFILFFFAGGTWLLQDPWIQLEWPEGWKGSRPFLTTLKCAVGFPGTHATHKYVAVGL